MHFTIWMTGTLLSFSLMAIGARELSGEIPVFQTLFFRSLIGLGVVSAILIVSKNIHLVYTQRFTLHSFRNTFHLAGQYGWFLGIGALPLAEVFALEFTVPLWTAIIASIFLKEKITTAKVIAILLGLIGVLVIVQPGYAIINIASLIVLASAICYGVAHTSTKSLSSTESPMTIIFYMSLIQLPIGLIFSIDDWVWPDSNQWQWITLIGLTALSAHFCMAKAMLRAEITTIVIMDFLRLPLIAIVGIMLYRETLEIALLLGGLLMLAGNLTNLYRPAGTKTVERKEF